MSVCTLVYVFVYSGRPNLPFPCRALCRQAQHERTMTMNDVTNKEKQFEEAGKRRIVLDGDPIYSEGVLSDEYEGDRDG